MAKLRKLTVAHPTLLHAMNHEKRMGYATTCFCHKTSYIPVFTVVDYSEWLPLGMDAEWGLCLCVCVSVYMSVCVSLLTNLELHATQQPISGTKDCGITSKSWRFPWNYLEKLVAKRAILMVLKWQTPIALLYTSCTVSLLAWCQQQYMVHITRTLTLCTMRSYTTDISHCVCT